MSPTKLGVLGLATGHPLAFTEELRGHGFELACLAFDDTQEEERQRAATLQQKYPSLEVVAGAAEMLARGVQAGMCSSQAHRHLEHVRPWIEARLPFFLEKPMAPDYASARAILDLVEQHDAPMMSCSVRYFSRNYRDLMEVMRSGKIGTPLFLECFEPHGAHPGYWQDLKSASGGLVINYGIHVADPLVEALGTDLRAVHAFGGKQVLPDVDSEDTAIFTAQFGSGAIAVGKVSGAYHFGAGKPVPTVGHLIVHASEGTLETHIDETDVKVYRGGNFGVSASLDPKTGVPAAMAAYVEMVATGQRPIPVAHMDAVMKLLDAARRSIDTGQVITFP